jgi:periplasmic copper chaperone A
VKRILLVIFIAALLLSACTAEEAITVYNAWMRPTAPGENGAVYFILYNHSAEADELVAASFSIAESVEIHESSMAQGTDVMQMNQVFSLPLEKGSEVAFEPGGLHVMLVNVSRELTIGENVELTLHFKNHEDIPVNISVAEFTPTGDEHSH